MELGNGLLTREFKGSLSNDDGDGNENGKKAIDLYEQKNNFARGRLRRENASFHVLWRTKTQDNDFLFLFLNFNAVF